MKRAVIWAQSLLGSGHLQRARLLARALDGQGIATSLLTALHDNAMPVVRAMDGSFRLVDREGRPADAALWRARREWLACEIKRSPPDAAIVEMWPFGRRQFDDEVLALVAMIKAANPVCKIIGSVRDILVTKGKFARYREMRGLWRQHLDHLLIHSDPRFIDFTDSFPYINDFNGQFSYTGFVVGAPPKDDARPGRSGVLVSAGGGIVGGKLIGAALGACRLGHLAGQHWTIIVGKNGKIDKIEGWRAGGSRDVSLIRHVDDLKARMRRAALSISQAGYNSCVEIIQTGVPALLVPYDDDGQDEQMRRARRFESLAIARVVDARRLGANRLARAAERQIASANQAPCGADLTGAARSANIVAELMAG